jgi:predicted enzyme related to lactoylglutathione lyase
MSNPVIWFEVMGQDADKFSNFYGRRRRTTDPPSDLRETGHHWACAPSAAQTPSSCRTPV